MMNSFKNKKILITGHTGFKGSWLSVWLKVLGADLIGISNSIGSEASHYKFISGIFSKNIIGDIRELDFLKNIIEKEKPEFIFHLAAQALVTESYKDPHYTFSANTFGTINLLESLRKHSARCNVVIITSDKSYENRELKRGYTENDRFGGFDPYSGSKGAAELAIKSYFHSYFKAHPVKIAIARAGNVIGGGDWSKDRIIPDAIKAWQQNKPLIVRNPDSTRPWQHVLDPLHGYLTLAENLKNDGEINGEAFNFGPGTSKIYKVKDVCDSIEKYLPGFSWESSNEMNEIYESKLLALDSTKAFQKLGWSTKLDFKEALILTSDWYKEFYSKSQKEILKYTISQIKFFMNKK